MPKIYSNVSNMAKGLLDKDTQNELVETINSRKLSKLLFSMRCSFGISQGEMANRLNCTQSRISKVENSIDVNLKIKDLADYAGALNLQLNIGYANRARTSVDSIKYHAFKIKEHLDKLADFAKKDDEIFKGVSGFFGEYFFNMLNLFDKSVKKLKKHQKIKREVIHITQPVNLRKKEIEEVLHINF